MSRLRKAMAPLALLGVVAVLLAAKLFWPGIAVLAICPGVMLLSVLLERSRYKPLLQTPPPGADWSPTAERFLDSRTGQPVEVWYNADTGARAYVFSSPPSQMGEYGRRPGGGRPA